LTRTPARPDLTTRLWVEPLEQREVPSVTIADIQDQQIANDRPFYIPVTVTNTPSGTVATSVTSSNPAIKAEVLGGGRSVQFDVSGGTGSSAFSGTLTIRLFEDIAPLASQRIVDLINDGFYTGKVFHRIADLLDSNPAADPTNIIVQGGSPNGDGVGGSTRADIVDEFNRDFTFASNGLVAFANARDDNNNSQFFITDLNRPLAQRVEFLNFNHTIFGILTNGFATFNNIRNTPVSGTTPVSPVTITAARVLNPDPNNAVVKLTPASTGFTGTATIAVNSTDSGPAGGSTSDTFVVTAVADTTNSRAFVGAIGDQTTTAGKAVSFTIPFTDIDGDQVTFAVRNSNPGQTDDFSKAPANVSVNIDQATGRVTLTPTAGFTGTVTFKVGVRDQTDRTGQGLDATGNFDTQVLNLRVDPAPPPTVPPPPTTITAEGSPAGSEPRVTVTNPDGSQRFSVVAFAPSFTGGVRTAVLGDVNGDGMPDVVAVPADGGAPVVEILSGNDGTVLSMQTVFEDTFRGGLFVEVNGNQVVVGAGDTGGPRVTVLDATTGAVVQNFFAGPEEFRGGVSVALAPLVSGSSTVNIVTGLGPGAGPVVSVFDVSNAALGGPIGSFFAGPEDDRRGITVGVGDVSPTSNVSQIIVTPIGTLSSQPFDPSQFIALPGATGTPGA
jgi:cyclophilin family peptidyl-prolyl cis-trans isomerase